jgi:hypothetical protein
MSTDMKGNKGFKQGFAFPDGSGRKFDTVCPCHLHGIDPGQLLQGPLGHPAPLGIAAKSSGRFLRSTSTALALWTDNPTRFEIKPESGRINTF